MIEVDHLTKRYGEKYAVNDISFTVPEGEILGFLGPNGAGKSTTMNILTGYLSSSSGTVKIAGVDILEDPNTAKGHIGYLPEQPPLYFDMTVKEYLGFIYDLKGCKLKKDAHLREICNLVKISNVYGRLIKNLSKGYRQRVGFAQALVGNPEVLILDEPTVGLDPKQIIEIRSLIKHLGRKHTVILSSHILSEIQSVCDHIIIINKGRIVANDTTANLSDRVSGRHSLELRVAAPDDAVTAAVRNIEGVNEVISLGTKEPESVDLRIETAENADIRRTLFKVLAEKDWPILALDNGELTLEDIFIKLTSSDPADVSLTKAEAPANDPEESGGPDNDTAGKEIG